DVGRRLLLCVAPPGADRDVSVPRHLVRQQRQPHGPPGRRAWGADRLLRRILLPSGLHVEPLQVPQRSGVRRQSPAGRSGTSVQSRAGVRLQVRGVHQRDLRDRPAEVSGGLRELRVRRPVCDVRHQTRLSARHRRVVLRRGAEPQRSTVRQLGQPGGRRRGRRPAEFPSRVREGLLRGRGGEMVRIPIVFILFLGASCASPSGEARTPAGVRWEPQARAVGNGRDGQIMTWPSESPSLVVAAPGEKPGSADLMYSNSKDEGGTFAHPLRVNPLPGEVSAHGENAPQLRLLRGSAILAAWEGRGDIRFARCVDFGRSFLPAITVNDDGGENYQSFFAMETGPDGSLYLAWIDFRDTKTDPPGTASIYLARSDDLGATFGKNVKVA